MRDIQPVKGVKGPPACQKVTDIKIDRTFHVWYYRPECGDWKCVICGGVTEDPGNLADCKCYEHLSKKEREMCPPRDEPINTENIMVKKGKR